MKQKQRLARRVPNMIILGISIACMAIIAMAPLPAANAESPERWYEQSRVESGQSVYEKNCSNCHGTRGEATVNWRRPDSDGKFPPPPLNGTAHTWHHPFRVLVQQIKFGPPAGAGTMPAFKDILNDEKIINVIAWIQSLWSDEIYAQWWNIQVPSSR